MKKSYHFIGIGGIGMSGLAALLLDRGTAVTGSDVAAGPIVERLSREGAVIYKGQAADNLQPGSTVVYSSDIKSDNPEFKAAREGSYPLLHRSDLLNELVQGRKALAVAGTHGKTTTSSLLATVLVRAGSDPSFAIGGILREFQSNARGGEGEFFVLEADESDRSFLKYHPFGAIVTNVDHEHLSHYGGDFSVLLQSVKQFAGQVHSPEHLFWCGDDPSLVALALPGTSYGFDSSCTWRIIAARQQGFRTYFDLAYRDRIYREIELALSGSHNALNAAAVFGLAFQLGIQEEQIREAFRQFGGVLRRCEPKGSVHGVLFLDDYAHHPVEVYSTLRAIRQAIGSRRMITIFQPHRYSRTQECLGKYGSIFDSADCLLLADIYGAGEAPVAGLSSEVILEEVRRASPLPCRCLPSTAIAHYLSQRIRPRDVVVTLGAGDITKVGGESIALLEKSPPSPLKVGWIWDEETYLQFREGWKQSPLDHSTSYTCIIRSGGFWFEGAEGVESEGGGSRLPLAVIRGLSECDVVLSLLGDAHRDEAVRGFVDLLGKPCVGCDWRPFWLAKQREGEQLLESEAEPFILSALRAAPFHLD